MSQTTEGVSYVVQGDANRMGTFLTVNFSSDVGGSDATVLAFIENLRSFAWPAEMQPVNISATRTDTTTVLSQCGPATEPAAFN